MIASLTPFSLIDYPKKLSCILWFGGCNLRCQYCYNTELISPTHYLCQDEIFAFLQSRVGLLDGVVCSGGECTLWGERLLEFAKRVKSMGFALKVDSNGSNPKVLKELLDMGLLDYVALDFKALAYKLQVICGKDYFKEFEESFTLLRDSQIPYEVRTTFHSLLLTPIEIEQMRDWLRERGYQGEYYVQGFVGEKGSLGNLKESENGLLSEIEDIVVRGGNK